MFLWIWNRGKQNVDTVKLCSSSRLTDSLSLCVFIGSMNNILPQVEPLQERPGERRGSRAYQVEPIFSSRFPFLSLSFTGAAALELLPCFSQAVVATATCNTKRLRAAEQQLSSSIYMNKALRWPTCCQLSSCFIKHPILPYWQSSTH